MKTIAQGAEAVLSAGGGKVLKDRVKKSYRHPKLDQELRKARTTREANLLRKARRAGVLTPSVLETSDHKIEMEHIKGKKVKDFLDSATPSARSELCKRIGESIAKLHNNHIIHGDLTTSNMLITEKDELYFIDFGLGDVDKSVEAKATDLHLLKQVFKSTHFRHFEAWKDVLAGYESWSGAKDVLTRLKTVEKRGRYKNG